MSKSKTTNQNQFGKDQPKHYCGQKGRSGPKKSNLNALKNATKIHASRLVVGELPSQLLSVKREGRKYRVALETVVLELRDEINTMDAHHIDTAAGATVHAGICRWLLRAKIKTMSTPDILACSRELLQAKKIRDLAVKGLDLNAPPENPWAMSVESEEASDDK